jgi:hypothetical protein
MRLTLGHFRTIFFTVPVPTFGLTAILVGSMALFISYRFAGQGATVSAGSELTGKWTGRQAISVRLKQNWKQHSFVSAGPVVTRIMIHADGAVTGTAGDAVFTDCMLQRSRGHVLRLLQIGTDFEIRGWLSGPVFQGDTIKAKQISIPFDLENDRMSGTLFHLQKGGLYPMSAQFGLERGREK